MLPVAPPSLYVLIHQHQHRNSRTLQRIQLAKRFSLPSLLGMYLPCLVGNIHIATITVQDPLVGTGRNFLSTLARPSIRSSSISCSSGPSPLRLPPCPPSPNCPLQCETWVTYQSRELPIHSSLHPATLLPSFHPSLLSCSALEEMVSV